MRFSKIRTIPGRLNLAQTLGFIREAPIRLRVARPDGGQDLDRHVLTRVSPTGSIDHAERTLAEPSRLDISGLFKRAVNRHLRIGQTLRGARLPNPAVGQLDDLGWAHAFEIELAVVGNREVGR